MLRMMFGPVVEQGIWRIRNNQEWGECSEDVDIEWGECSEDVDIEWGECSEDVDIEADIKNKGLEWIGHVVRMGQGRTVK